MIMSLAFMIALGLVIKFMLGLTVGKAYCDYEQYRTRWAQRNYSEGGTD